MHDDTTNIKKVPDGLATEDGKFLEGNFISYSILFEENMEYWVLDENTLANSVKQYFLRYGVGYCIMSFIDFDGTWFANISGVIHKKSFQADSESEVIFKAAEWIIDLEDANEKIVKDAELQEQYGDNK